MAARISAAVLLALFLLPGLPGLAETTLVPFGPRTQWKYLDDGSDPGIAWRGASFDDASWRSGKAPLGYGDARIATRVGFGKDPRHKHITTFFRHSFDVACPSGLAQILFRVRSDDGIVVYLNGKEVLRNNLPQGEISSQTTAIRALNDLDERLWRRFCVPGSLLAAGKNHLAVEVHQVQSISTDLFLDLELTAYASSEDLRPAIAATARSQSALFRKEHRIPAGQPIVDGYMDGGRQSKISVDGRVSSAREVIVVDRGRDETLRQHLEFARLDQLKSLLPVDRAAVLAVYVDRVMANEVGPQYYYDADKLLVQEYREQPVLLGDVPRLCGSGMCRHRATLFKVLGDEAGLQVALVRGNLERGRVREGHDWNELQLEPGRTAIVDTSARPPVIRFYETRTDEGRRYRTVNGEPMYVHSNVK